MMAMRSNFGNMFSMAGATLILPFLPMLPVQILLNNLLYAVSEMPIPMDEVDSEITEMPEHWDTRFIRNFTLVLGPVISIFDFLTFALLILVVHAKTQMLRTRRKRRRAVAFPHARAVIRSESQVFRRPRRRPSLPGARGKRAGD